MENRVINNLRVLSLYEIEKAKSGHPGIALSSAPILYSLYANVMNYSCQDDKNIFRDRFVMSAGHGSSLLYATLHMFGFDLTMNDLQNFRKLGSKTPGHPEYNVTSGVDFSAGPLGQGVASAVGMAISAKKYQAEFNKKDIKLFDNKIYCLVGDGCLMEGISYEALSIAGNLKLDNLIVIYDCNYRTIDGSTNITWTENVKTRFEAMNFDVFEVYDGNNSQEITDALNKAKNSEKPSIVVVKTVLGFGSELADNSKVHGTPLSLEQIEIVKKNLNCDATGFEILEDVKNYVEQLKGDVKKRFENQMLLLEDYKQKYPKDYQKMLDWLNFDKNEKAIKQIKNFECSNSLPIRDIHHELFSSFRLKNFVGGCADVEASTKVFNKFDEEFSSQNYTGNKLRFGIREHAMAGICNGISLFGGMMAYYSCFFSFVDYLKPSLRLGALMNLPNLAVFTHDSFMVGEDGPTHQPVEQLVSLRATPNLNVFRAYNLDEIKACYIHFLKSKTPTCLVLSRAKYKMENTSVEKSLKGGYVVKKFGSSQSITLIATGSEVELALDVAEILNQNGVFTKVVSMPCVEIFDKNEQSYKNKILGKRTRIFTIEAGSELGLIKFVKNGMSFSINDFGKSSNAKDLKEYFEFNPEQIALKITNFLKK